MLIRPPKRRSHVPSVRTEFFKSLYLGCLKYLEPADIVNVFARSVENLPGSVESSALLQTIWHEKGFIPLDNLLAFMNELETTLIGRSTDPAEFLLRTVVEVNNGAMMSSPSVLDFFVPYIGSVFKVNIRELLLDMIVPLNEHIFRGIETKVIRKTKTGLWFECVVATMIPTATNRMILGAYWLAPLFRSMGTGLGLPPVDEVTTIAETLSIDEMISTGRIDARAAKDIDSAFTETSFGNLLKMHGLPFGNQSNARIKVCTRTVCDKSTGLEIVREGCAYGAPLMLFRIRARRKYNQSSFTLKDLVDKALGKKAAPGLVFNQRHERVLALVGPVAHFVFSSDVSRLTLNGHCVCGGVPARILWTMLSAHQQSGTTEFCRVDFVQDPKVVKNKLDKSFNLNVKRAMQHAHTKIPSVSIDRQIGTGKITLQVGGGYTMARE